MVMAAQTSSSTNRSHPPFSCSAVCVPVSFFVREEHLPENCLLVLPELQDGDILITDCAHTFGWRHGHGALVVNGAKNPEEADDIVAMVSKLTRE